MTKQQREFCRFVLAISVLSASFSATAQRAYSHDILADTFGYGKGARSSVKLADLSQGCRSRDCIPSIDNPKYVLARDASFLADDDIVLALEWKGYHRAWPVRILDQHEIVNDFMAGTPIAITWCPLCGSAVGVLREIDGRTVEFGVSGLLYNSDLVFYDRATDTLWDQIEAKGIVGPLTDTELELVPIAVTRWEKWKSSHPDTTVLSTDTGFPRDYSADVYGSYRDGKRLMFPVSKRNNKIHPKSVVYGFDLGEQTVAFKESSLNTLSNNDHVIGGRTYSLDVAGDGVVTLEEADAGTVHSPIRLFWFAWFTFHPETELLQ